MKTITSDYKENIKLAGRQLDNIITFTINNVETELGNEELNSVNMHYDGAILKSVMKQLDIDSNVNIPVGTILTYKFGILIENEYEYINFGKFVVKEVEKQEDTNSWMIKCCDKILYSMKDYEKLNITYPITIRNYLNAICNYLNIGFENLNDIFANYNKQIQNELYLDATGNSLGYTFRDVLDEIAQATGSIICINANDKLEVRYLNNTGDTIDEEYLKDKNVNFSKKYGPINSVVLSRSAESDNVYLRNEESIRINGLCEIKIVDNQIMNWNDRSNYLPEILYRLLGIEYTINDFDSTGITYYDLFDKYNIQIGENVYPCIMLNDDINVNNGLVETIYTEEPNESKTDYTKADKTDRRINQTYLIVDKQNQKIESVVSSTAEQNTKISQLTQTVDELNSRIQEIADISVSGETTLGRLNLSNVLASIPILIRIYPTAENIDYLYPNTTLYPSTTLYPKIKILRFTNIKTNEIFDYEIPDGLLYYSDELYDELYISGDSETCQIIKRCKYNNDGTIGALAEQQTITYPFPYNELNLSDGDYTVEVLGYNNAYMFVRLLAENLYTTMYPTKIEMRSEISQTKSDITAEVNEKLEDYSTTTEMNSAISLKANEITSSVSETYATKNTTNTLSSRISQTTKNITLQVNNGSTSSGIIIGITKEDGSTSQATGTIQMNGLVTFTNLKTSGQTEINGANIQTGTLSATKITSGTLDASKVTVTNLNASNITSGTLTSRAINNGNGTFKVTTAGAVTASNITATGGKIGRYEITSTYLQTGSGSSQAGMGGAMAFWAGAENSAEAPFHVSYGGSLTATNATISGTITGSTIKGSTIKVGNRYNGGTLDYYNGSGYLNCGIVSDHPYVSGLNIGTSGLSFRTGSSPTSVGSAWGGISLASGDLLFASSNGDARINGYHVKLEAYGSSGNVYARSRGGGNKLVNTDGGYISSLNLKENIKQFDNSEYENAYKLLQNIDMYRFNYKYKGISNNKNEYGFIIDYIEKNKDYDKFLYFEGQKANVMENKELDYLIDENSKNVIDFKKYDTNNIMRYLFTLAKTMQIKIDELERKINNE